MILEKWQELDKLTGNCYGNMIGAYKDNSCWEKTFDLLMEIIEEERAENKDFALQLDMIDDVTDYNYDILGWMEDCLDELDMRKQYDLQIKMCDELLAMFEWPEYTGSDYKFIKSEALLSLGREEEASVFCQEWTEKEPDNIKAAVAYIYVLIKEKAYDKAEKLIEKFIPDRSECTYENEIMFMAACKLYEASGEKTKWKQMDQALEDYDKTLGEFFLDGDEFEEEFPPF